MIGSVHRCLVGLSLTLWAIATPAAANTITYNWLGIVDQSDLSANPSFTVGEKIKISLTLDDVIPDTAPSLEIGQYDADIFNPPVLVLAANIGGIADTGTFQFAQVFNGHNGTDAFSVDSGGPTIGNVFSIDFSTSDLGVLTSDALPLSINPGDFDTASFSVYGDGPPGFSGRIISSVGTVPLPGSAFMLVSALTGLVGAGCYKLRCLRTTAL